MTMFNSRKISNDPTPWVNPKSGGRYAPGTVGQFYGDFEYSPRPEFDNNPNPILLAFREAVKADPDAAREPYEWLLTAWLEVHAGTELWSVPHYLHAEHVLRLLEAVREA